MMWSLGKLDWPKKGIVATESDSKKDENLEAFQTKKGNQIFYFQHLDPQKVFMKTSHEELIPKPKSKIENLKENVEATTKLCEVFQASQDLSQKTYVMDTTKFQTPKAWNVSELYHPQPQPES